MYPKNDDPTLVVVNKVFRASIKYLNECASRRVTDDEKLLLYGYYKQATLNNGTTFPSRPSAPLGNDPRETAIFSAKWEAWRKVSHLTKLQAMLGYIRVVDSIAGCGKIWRQAVNCNDDLICGHSSEESEMESAEEDSIPLTHDKSDTKSNTSFGKNLLLIESFYSAEYTLVFQSSIFFACCWAGMKGRNIWIT